MKTITAAELDEKFDNGEDISEYLDFSKATRPNLEIRQLSIDLPVWAINKANRRAIALGLTKEAFLERWLIESLSEVDEERSKAKAS